MPLEVLKSHLNQFGTSAGFSGYGEYCLFHWDRPHIAGRFSLVSALLCLKLWVEIFLKNGRRKKTDLSSSQSRAEDGTCFPGPFSPFAVVLAWREVAGCLLLYPSLAQKDLPSVAFNLLWLSCTNMRHIAPHLDQRGGAGGRLHWLTGWYGPDLDLDEQRAFFILGNER